MGGERCAIGGGGGGRGGGSIESAGCAERGAQLQHSAKASECIYVPSSFAQGPSKLYCQYV